MVGAIDGTPALAAQGSFGQFIAVVPDHRLVVVVVCDETGLESPTQEFYNMLDDDIVRPILQS